MYVLDTRDEEAGIRGHLAQECLQVGDTHYGFGRLWEMSEPL